MHHVFCHDYRRVHQNTNRNHDASERHDVGLNGQNSGQAQHANSKKGQQHTQRKSQCDNQPGSKVSQHNQDADRSNDQSFQQCPRNRIHRAQNQWCSIVTRNNSDARRQADRNFNKAIADRASHFKHVVAVPQVDDSCNAFRTFFLKCSSPRCRTDRKFGEFSKEDRCSVSTSDDS